MHCAWNGPFLSSQLPTDKEEIKLTLSSLDISKATGPYSIPTKVLKLLKNDISFTRGSYPTLLKTAKVISIHEKQSKLDYINYRPIFLLSNLDKTLEKLMRNRLYKFLNDNNIIINIIAFDTVDHNILMGKLKHYGIRDVAYSWFE